MLIYELNTKQLLNVEFDHCDIVKNMLQTCYAYPEDYPLVDIDIAGKIFKAWFVGQKATGNRVFILKNGVFVTKEKKRVKDLSTVIFRLRLERD